MSKFKIYSKSKTLLINELNKHVDLEFLHEKSIGKVEADIYFHSGKIDASAITLILQTPIVIVNSNSAKKEILNKTEVDETKIHVIYPSIKKSDIDIKEAKKDFFEELEIPKKTRIIFFTARTLKTNGIKELFDTLLTLNNDNYKLIIASDKEQITALKFQITKYKLDDKVIFYEDFKNIDLLYAVSDIFVLPTYVKNFSLNILKAMSLKTAVFVSSNNSASELVDIFATMESPRDSNTSFKIDALLREKDDLKLIKKTNNKVAKGFYIEKQLQKI